MVPHEIGCINTVENVQRYFTRRVAKINNINAISYANRLQLLEMKSLEECWIIYDLKLLKKLQSKNFENVFTYSNINRRSNNFFQNYCRTKC